MSVYTVQILFTPFQGIPRKGKKPSTPMFHAESYLLDPRDMDKHCQYGLALYRFFTQKVFFFLHDEHTCAI